MVRLHGQNGKALLYGIVAVYGHTNGVYGGQCCRAILADCKRVRNREKRLVERASVHDFALKTTIVEG